MPPAIPRPRPPGPPPPVRHPQKSAAVVPPPKPVRPVEPARDAMIAPTETVVDRRYTLVRELARGGIGVVFEARHRFTGRNVALKVLIDERRSETEAGARLLREARALGLVRHPNVVDLLDAGETDADGPYLVMEMLHGRTLEGLLASRGALPVNEAARVCRDLCLALDGVHRAGVVHRDLKPSNVFIALRASGRERVTLFDFGIAAVLDDAPTPLPENHKLTQQGELLGTPEYMAPERLLAQSMRDPKSDLYAVGVTLYECLTGVVPFEGNYGEVLLKRSTTPVPPLREKRPDVPAELEALVLRTLEANAADRIGSASELAAALTPFANAGEPSRGLLGVRPAAPAVVPVAAPGAKPRPAPPPLPGTAARQEPPRRRHARAPYVTPVRILRADGRTVDGNSEDLSEGGLLVFTPWPCDNGEEVEVRFALPLTGRIVTLKATTRWIRTARRAGATGLEFLDAPKPVCVEIADYVRAMGAS